MKTFTRRFTGDALRGVTKRNARKGDAAGAAQGLGAGGPVAGAGRNQRRSTFITRRLSRETRTRVLLWATVIVALAGLGWAFGTPYLNAGPIFCFGRLSDDADELKCLPPLVCSYYGLQGGFSTDRVNSCPPVRLFKWDNSRTLFSGRVRP